MAGMGKKIYTHVVLLAFVSFIVYLPVLSFYFCSDDFGMVGNFSFHEVLKCFLGRCAISENASGWYRPTTILLYFMEYHLWGYHAFGYHFTNLILHAGCTLAVYFFSSALTKNREVSLLSALFFAVHPIHVDAIAWISTRHALLAAFFYVLSFVFFLRSRKRRNVYAYGASVFFFVLALCSKEDAVTLPFVLLVYRFMLDREFKLLLLSPFFLLMFFYLTFKALVLKTPGGFGMDFVFLQVHPSVYLREYLMVRIQQLSFPYAFRETVLPVSLVFAWMLSLFIFYLKKFTQPAFLMIFLAFTFLPYIFVSTNPWMGGWHVYLPSVPFCILLGKFFVRLIKDSPEKITRALSCFGAACVVFFYVFTSIGRLGDWEIASRLSREIPQRIRAFIPAGEKAVRIYAYGIPHNYKGAYVYANGFESALKMSFNDPSLKAHPEFLLNLPALDSLGRVAFVHHNYIFVCLNGTMYRLLPYTRKQGYYLFEELSGRKFYVVFKDYYPAAKKIIEKYATGNNTYASYLQGEINNEIARAMLKHVIKSEP